MATITDQELISMLLQATEGKRIAWQKTDVPDRFSAKYAGKWTLTVDMSNDPDDYGSCWLALSNSEGEEILRVHSSQEKDLSQLFELARRRAFNVDEALNDLAKEIGGNNKPRDEDIRF